MSCQWKVVSLGDNSIQITNHVHILFKSADDKEDNNKSVQHELLFLAPVYSRLDEGQRAKIQLAQTDLSQL